MRQRKQGEWIEANIPEDGSNGGNPNLTKNSQVTLADAGIDKHDSPKFRILAKIPAPARGNLSEGWHHTERYGDVYVSPGGIAWVVQQVGNELKSVSVSLTPADITKTPAVERMKHIQKERRYRKTRVSVTQSANLPLQQAELMAGGVR